MVTQLEALNRRPLNIFKRLALSLEEGSWWNRELPRLKKYKNSRNQSDDFLLMRAKAIGRKTDETSETFGMKVRYL